MPDVTFNYIVQEVESGGGSTRAIHAGVPVSITFGAVTKTGLTNALGEVSVGPFTLAASTNGTMTVNYPAGSSSLHLAGFTTTVYVVITNGVLDRVSPYAGTVQFPGTIGLARVRTVGRFRVVVYSSRDVVLPGAVVTVEHENWNGQTRTYNATTDTEGRAYVSLELTRVQNTLLSVRVAFGGENQVLVRNINYDLVQIDGQGSIAIYLPGVSDQAS